MVGETNALAAFNLPPVLSPESVQTLVNVSTNFQGIHGLTIYHAFPQRLQCLSYVLYILGQFPSLYHDMPEAVKYCLAIVQHPNSLT